MNDQTCRICGARIRTMAYRNSGACSQRHLEELKALEARPAITAPGGWCAPSGTFAHLMDVAPPLTRMMAELDRNGSEDARLPE